MMRYEKEIGNTDETIHLAELEQMQRDNPQLSSLSTSMLTWIEENCHDIISVLNEDGLFVYTSKSVERILGYHPSQLIGKPWYTFVSTEDIDYIKENCDRSPALKRFYQLNVLNSAGEAIWSSCTLTKMKEKDTGRTYYLSIIADKRDKKEVEEIMIQSEKMSVAGQLAAGVAHEIRNPLTSLKGFLQLLQAGVRKEEYYNIMIEEIEKMETITSELLFISKPLTETKKLESIDSMIRDVIVLLGPQAKMKGIFIEYGGSEKDKIYCDRSQIKQVLINLIKNAIEAMEQGGSIRIVTSSSDSHVDVCIIDEGPGIPQEIIHKLGEPFFTTKQSGTGLGLMITKQILERHQAFLEVKANEQIGSTFRIIFPIPA